VAFVNQDGKKVAIITNSGEPATVNLRDADIELPLALERDSVTTVVY
jgi:O-glycosyl hydrolase